MSDDREVLVGSAGSDFPRKLRPSEMSNTPRTDAHTEPAMDMTGEKLLVRFDQLARESRALETELAARDATIASLQENAERYRYYVARLFSTTEAWPDAFVDAQSAEELTEAIDSARAARIQLSKERG